MITNLQKKRLVFIDLDGTLIKTASGETFPKGVWDMVFRQEVLAQLSRLKPTGIFIVSNQGGIEKGFVNHRLFEQKFMYAIASLQDICGQHVFVAGRYCPHNDPNDPMRKPNTGMVEAMLTEFEKMLNHKFSNPDCVVIGDMDSDRQMAAKLGMEYLDVEEFIAAEIPEPLYRVVDGMTGKDIEGQPLLGKQECKTLIDGLRESNPDRQYAMVTEKFIVPPMPQKSRQERRAEERRAAKAKPMVVDMSKVMKNRKKK